MSGKHKSVFRKIVGWLHLWLGLVSGLVVLIVSITGCLFVFEKEISDVTHKKILFVEKAHSATVPLSAMKEKAQTVLGTSMPVQYIITHQQPDRAWEFMAYKENDSALTYFGATEYFISVFVNPYTGEITGTRNYKTDFFNIIKFVHWSLLLNTQYGQPIVGWGTFIFVILLVTGLILWYPKKWNRATRQQAFKVKWKARFKRLNYDLHNVFGFYSMLLALILGLTGMVFSFQWFSGLVYAVAAGTTKTPQQKEIKSKDTAAVAAIPPLDIAFQSARAQLPDAKRIGISPASGEEGTIYMYGYKGRETYYNYDQLQFDQYSGQLLHRRNDREKNKGEKLIEMNYDIHVGAIGGLTGKIIAFIISFICASLPVTGFLVWWGKRKNRQWAMGNRQGARSKGNKNHH